MMYVCIVDDVEPKVLLTYIGLMKQTRVISAFNLFFSLLLSITNHHLFQQYVRS